ncbi:MAG: helix-turn-helix transcriptional regulator, partial [Deltaproteobacteria bacterium]|nr:helix-turn-helix transcriptional regulator [Deltaproteobacteria bacterium]
HLQCLKALRVRRHIRRNLLSPELTPKAIADRFQLSRTQLYRYFEAEGGVAAHIRNLRLERAFAALADARWGHQSIQAIAEEHGFSCEPHFSRLFRRTFGVTPSQARRAEAALPTDPSSGWPTLQSWLGRLT